MFESASRFFLIVLLYIVLCAVVYVLPAIFISLILLDKQVYLDCVAHPLYACIHGIISVGIVSRNIADIAEDIL